MTNLDLKPKEKFRFHDFDIPEWGDKVVLVLIWGMTIALVAFFGYLYWLCPNCKAPHQEQAEWQKIATYFFCIYGFNAAIRDIGILFFKKRY